MSFAEVAEKAADLLGEVLGDESARLVIEQVAGIEQLEELAPLQAALGTLVTRAR